MKTLKRKRVAAAGWRVGTVREFLGLSAAEAELVEMRVALGVGLKQRRERARLTRRPAGQQQRQ